MSAKHTPGPWLLAGDDFVYALNERGTNSFTALLQTSGEQRISNEERAANACLIAAAPDLLSAARCALNVLFLLEKEVSALGCNAKNVPENLRAAIAQAIGAAQ